MNRRLFHSLLLLAAVSVLGAGEPPKSSSPPDADSGRTGATNADYILQPQDMIRVQVFQEEDINRQGEVSISQELTISLPLIGTINLKDKTVRQAEEMIRALYDRDYLVNPQVSVIVVKYAERSVNVLGAVNNAGRIFFPQERGLTLLDAISLAGGHSRLADLRKVKLTRNSANGESTNMQINVDEIMKGDETSSTPLDVPLEKGDVIYVPERIF